jgi:transposase
VSGVPAAELSHEQLCALVARLQARVEELAAENAELRRRLGQNSSNSSRPPSSDVPWEKKPAPKRSARGRSGRKPGKQPGAGGVSRSLLDDPDERFEVGPAECHRCRASLADAPESSRTRRQVVDVRPAPPPWVTEYQLISKLCPCCGARSTGVPTGDAVAETAARPGSPVRVGPVGCQKSRHAV